MPPTPPPPPSDAPAPSGAESEHRFPCEACGSDLRFDPGAAELKCDHCGHSEAVTAEGPWQGAIRELDLTAALNNALPQQEMEETRVVTCPSCAAQIEFTPDAHAAECPFCATPVVTDTGTHRHIKPRGLVAFALNEEDARAAMGTWLGKLWFAPNGLQDYARRGRKMTGIYVPFWTFDADTESRYRGERGTVYYVTKTVIRDGKRHTVRVPKTRWRSVSGQVARFFDDVLVLASASLPKRFTDALAPWDLTALRPYLPDYLAGFRAEGYTIELSDGFTEAQARMEAMIRRDIRFDIGGDKQRIHHVDTEWRDLRFKHILLPVWIAAYKFRGKSYRFVVNGQTGRVQGERPWSVWKITLAVLAGLIVASTIGYFAAQMQ